LKDDVIWQHTTLLGNQTIIKFNKVKTGEVFPLFKR